MTESEYIVKHSMEPHIVYGILYYEWKDGVLNASNVHTVKISDLIKHYESVEDYVKCGDLSGWLNEIMEAKKAKA